MSDPMPPQPTPLAPALEAPTPADNPEMQLPDDFGPGAAGRLLFWIARGLLRLPDRHRLRHSAQSRSRRRRHPDPSRRRWPRALGGGGSASALCGAGRSLSRSLAFAAAAGDLRHPRRFAGGMPSQVLRTIHVGFLCLLAAGMLANHQRVTPRRQGALVGRSAASPSSPASITGNSIASWSPAPAT